MSHKRNVFVLMVLIVAWLALGLLPSASAQEEPPKPEAVGLRPDAPTYALHGSYWVGIQEIEAETPSHPTKVMVWYPALNPTGVEELSTFYYDYVPDLGNLPITYRALKDAAPDTSGGPYPLVIFAHGWNAQRHNGNWLCQHLASYGFVVMSIDQLDSQGNVLTAAFESMFQRPQEVTWQIDYADGLTAAGGALESMIDTGRVAVAGHSFGGYTALMAGGAQLDWDYFHTWCKENYERGFPAPELGGGNLCDDWDHPNEVAAVAGLDASQGGLWPSWGDSRVDAIVPLAPGDWPLWGPEGIKNISVPMLLMGGSGDRFVVRDWDLFYANVSSTQKALAVFTGADHNAFAYSCDAAPWFLDIGAYMWCSDAVWDMDRFHDLANHFTTAFLLSVLYQDKDAAVALAPDAMQFAGVTYEGQGF